MTTSQSFNQDTTISIIMPVCMCKTILNIAYIAVEIRTQHCVDTHTSNTQSWCTVMDFCITHTRHCMYRLLKLINNSRALNSLPMQNNNWWWCKHITIIMYNVQCSIINYCSCSYVVTESETCNPHKKSSYSYYTLNVSTKLMGTGTQWHCRLSQVEYILRSFICSDLTSLFQRSHAELITSWDLKADTSFNYYDKVNHNTL